MKLPPPTLDEVINQTGKYYFVPIAIIQVLLLLGLILSPALLIWISLKLWLKIAVSLFVLMIGVGIVYKILRNVTKEIILKELKRHAEESEEKGTGE